MRSIASLSAITTIIVLAVPLALTSGITSSATAQSPSFSSPSCIYRPGSYIEFGQEGGNIRPFAVKVNGNGTLTGDALGGIKRDRLSPLTVGALMKLAKAEDFWSMPERTGITGNPDVAARFITIHLPCATRHVAVRGGANDGQFAELYSTLSDLLIQPRSTSADISLRSTLPQR